MVEKRIFTLLFRVGFTHKQNVSFSPTVRNYIRNQEEHHRIKPFSENMNLVNSWAKARYYLVLFTPTLPARTPSSGACGKHWISGLNLIKSTLKSEVVNYKS
jgi:hypothetical protein